jgi:hypothetical protein
MVAENQKGDPTLGDRLALVNVHRALRVVVALYRLLATGSYSHSIHFAVLAGFILVAAGLT